MTYEEVFDLLHSVMPVLQMDLEQDAIDVILDALEKQIPRKPVYAATKKYKNIFDGSEAEVHEIESCPVCGFYPLETKYVRLHSCPKCNQSIDWGEEE